MRKTPQFTTLFVIFANFPILFNTFIKKGPDLTTGASSPPFFGKKAIHRSPSLAVNHELSENFSHLPATGSFAPSRRS